MLNTVRNHLDSQETLILLPTLLPSLLARGQVPVLSGPHSPHLKTTLFPVTRVLCAFICINSFNPYTNNPTKEVLLLFSFHRCKVLKLPKVMHNKMKM